MLQVNLIKFSLKLILKLNYRMYIREYLDLGI